MAASRRSDGMALFARLYHFARLVGCHEAAVSSDVCRQNRRQPSLHTLTRREVAPGR
jgi:hypothetical protein